MIRSNNWNCRQKCNKTKTATPTYAQHATVQTLVSKCRLYLLWLLMPLLNLTNKLRIYRPMSSYSIHVVVKYIIHINNKKIIMHLGELLLPQLYFYTVFHKITPYLSCLKERERARTKRNELFNIKVVRILNIKSLPCVPPFSTPTPAWNLKFMPMSFMSLFWRCKKPKHTENCEQRTIPSFYDWTKTT